MPWWSKVANLIRGNRHLDELDEEMEFHVAMRADEFRRAGLSESEALRAARHGFGNIVLQREQARDADILQWLDTFTRDLRFAARSFAKSPGLTSVVVLSLALGIGANTALFTITNALLIRTLPVARPDQLYTLQLGENDTATNPIWEDFRDHQDLFSSVFAWSTEAFDTRQGGEVSPVRGAYASGAMFRTLGLRPALGQVFDEAVDRPGSSSDVATAVLSYDYWQRGFGGDAAVLGRTLRLDGKPFRIAGVAQAGFTGIEVGERVDVIVPLASEPYLRGPDSMMTHGAYWWLAVAGRLKEGMPLAQGQSRVQALGAGVMERTHDPGWKPQVLKGYLSRQFSLVSMARGLNYSGRRLLTPVLLLNAVVILVLLIACANVANLLLARSAARRREISVRFALGASRARIVRQMLTESVLLALAGGGLGLVIAPPVARLLLAAATTRQEELFLDLHPDPAVLAFTTCVALLCGLLFGAAPAWRSARTEPQAGLRAASGADGDRRGALRSALVSFQVALSLVLVIGAGLFLTTLRNLIRTDLGFQPADVLLVDVDLSRSGVADAARPALHEELLARFQALPGFEAAAASLVTPLAGNTWQSNIRVESGSSQPVSIHVHYNGVTPGYFRTLGTPLLAGRDISSMDRANSAAVAVVNETFARRMLAALPGGRAAGSAAALGVRFRQDFRASRNTPAVERSVEIVGVVKDAKYRTIRGEVPPTVYMPTAQEQSGRASLNYELRTRLSLQAAAEIIRTAVAETNPRVSYTLRNFDSQARDATRPERLVAAFSTVFGGLALLLAGIGLYGVLSYSVAQRRGEIGIRVALGATPGNIRRWVVRRSLMTVAAGAVAGVTLAAGSTSLLRSMLYGVQPVDPLVYTAGLAILLTISALAAYLPARRATRLDPVQALRHE